MLEVLIALVLITTTLLGATALQLTGLQTNRGGYYRSQASVLAYDIADRIRINSSYALTNASSYQFDTSSLSVPSATSCITGATGCSAADLRARDIREWAEHFVDISGIGSDGGNYKATLPAGSGSVTASGATYSVQVNWNEIDWNLTSGKKAERTKQFTLDFTLAN